MKLLLFLILLLATTSHAAELDKGAILDLVVTMQSYEELNSQDEVTNYVMQDLTEAEIAVERLRLLLEYERLKSEAETTTDKILDSTKSESPRDYHYAFELYELFMRTERASAVLLSAKAWTMPYLELQPYENSFDSSVSLFYLSLEVGFPGLWDYKSD